MTAPATAHCTAPAITEAPDGRARLSAHLTVGGATREIWFEVPGAAVPRRHLGDAFALASLLPAMRHAEDLVIDATVSPLLLRNLTELQAIYSMWFPRFRKVEITAETETGTAADRPTTRGLFFSAGVDSNHTALTYPDPIDHLVYVDQLDTIVEDAELAERIRRSVRSGAEALGIPLMVVSSNIREVLNPDAFWAEHAHGLAIASVGHALSGLLTHSIQSADRTYAQLRPWGADPLTVPLFSSDQVTVRTFGWDVTRVDKAGVVAAHPEVLAHLRVCWENRDGEVNCGLCEKCVRTMFQLRIAGGVTEFPGFAHGLDLQRVAAMPLPGPTWVGYWEEALIPARAQPELAPLVTAMEIAARRARSHQALERLAADVGPASTDPGFGDWVETNRDLLYTSLSAHAGRWTVGRVIRDLPRKVAGKIRALTRRGTGSG